MATEILVPPLGTNVDTVTIVTWYKREGDAIASGEPLFSVETDKATLDVEAPASGFVRGVSAAEGDEVPALSRIAWICAESEQPPGSPLPVPTAHSANPVDPVNPVKEVTSAGDRRFASPWARTLAWETLRGTGPMGAVVARDVEAPTARTEQTALTEQMEQMEQTALTEQRPPVRPAPTPLAAKVAQDVGVSVGDVTGSGAGGRVTRDDVLRAADAARPSADVIETFGLTGIRGKIADRMHRGSTETAPVTLTAEVDATALVERRKVIVSSGFRVTYNDLLMHIVARALTEHPRMNAVYEGGRAVVRRSADIALAVDTDRGLLAPVVRGVDNMTVAQIAAASADLIERTRAGQVTPEDLRGSTFTITNLGMFGIDAFTPIINLPECAILGVGRIKPTPWVVDGRVEVRQVMWMSLTFDHRLVDGGPAARFLQAIVTAVEAGQ